MSNYLKSLIFWRKSSKDISGLSSAPIGKKLSLQLDFSQESDLGVIPTYVQLDPDMGDHRKEVTRVMPNFYDTLIREAPLLPAELKTKDGRPPPLPTWLDTSQLTRGLSFVQSHFYSIFCAHVLSLFLIVTVRPVQALLLRTTSFHNTHEEEDGQPSPSLLFTLKTVLKIKNIYEELRILGNTSNRENSEFPEMTEIRQGMKSTSGNFKKFLPPLSTDLNLSSSETLEFMKLHHGLTAKCPVTQGQLRSVEKIRTTLNPEVPLSQYDLAIIQFSFCTLPVMFPKLFGLPSHRRKNLQGFSHVWALLGHSLGLRNEFNFALLQSTQPELKWSPVAMEVLEKIFKFSLTQMDSMGFKLWILLSTNLRREWFGWIFLVNLSGVIHFLSKSILDIRSLDTLGWGCRVNYGVHRGFVQFSKCWMGRLLLNSIFKWILTWDTWFYIRRHAKKRNGNNDLSASRMSLTRSIRWSSKEDGIAFDIV